MKKTLSRVALLLCLVAVLFVGVAAAPPDLRPEPVYYVMSSTMPDMYRRGGPDTWLCRGDNDEVQIQAAIDAAEAATLWGSFHYAPEVVLSPGRFNIAAPIDMGFSGAGVPAAQRTCRLRGSGGTFLNWTGSPATAPGTFMLRCSSLADRTGRVENLVLECNGKVDGLFMARANRTVFRHIQVLNSKYLGIVGANAWFTTLDHISISEGTGVAIMLLECNAARVRNLIVADQARTNMPEVYSYAVNSDGAGDYTHWSTFQYLEELTGGGGSETCLFLGYASMKEGNSIVVAHTGTHDGYDDNEILTGGTTGDKAAIELTAADNQNDFRAAIVSVGDKPIWQNVDIEDVEYADNDDGYPLMLVTGLTGGATLENFRFEGGATGYGRKLADVWIHVKETEAVRIRDIHGYAEYVGRTYNDTMTDNGADGTVSGMATTTDVDVADTVYIWDPHDNDFAPAEFTVASKTSTSITTNEDPGATDDDGSQTNVYFVTAVTRDCPDVMVLVEESLGCSVDGVRGYGCNTAYVEVDSTCQDCSVSNVYSYRTTAGSLSDDWWLWKGPRPPHLLDAGARTRAFNIQVPALVGVQYTGYTNAKYATEEAVGGHHSTTIQLHRMEMPLTDGTPIAWDSIKLYDFPAGAIQIIGATVDLRVTKSSAGVNNDWDGDFSLGTTGTADTTLDGTDVDILASTATTQAVGTAFNSIATVQGQSAAAEHVIFDGTGTAKDLYISLIIDDADQDVAGTACTMYVQGTVTIHWVNLGDY